MLEVPILSQLETDLRSILECSGTFHTFPTTTQRRDSGDIDISLFPFYFTNLLPSTETMPYMPYSLTYDTQFHDPPLEEIPEGRGACDSVIIFSILHTDEQTELLDGATDTMILSQNGRTRKEFTPDELFQSWAVMAAHLAEHLPEGNKKAFCTSVRDAITKSVQAAKASQLPVV